MYRMRTIIIMLFTALFLFTAAVGTGCSRETSVDVTAVGSTETPSADVTADSGSETPSADVTAENNSAPDSSYTITSVKMPYYLMSATPYTSGEIDVYFVNGSDVPYLEIEDWLSIQQHPMFTMFTKDTELTASKEGDIVKISRKNGSNLSIYFHTDIMVFDDYNAFISAGGKGLLDIVIMPRTNTDGTPMYLSYLDSSVRKYGHEKTMDLGYYDIDLVRDGDRYYIPLQTLSDLFFVPYAKGVMYNGRCIYIYAYAEELLRSADGTLTDVGKAVFGENGEYATGRISETMAKFNYDELCFAFDHIYGLKEIHHITGFRELVREKGFEDVFLGTDTKKIDEALCRIIGEAIDDIHSKYVLSSYASGIDYKNELISKYGEGRSRTNILKLLDEYKAEREKYYPEGIPGYEEIGDTAFITFDEFLFAKRSYYLSSPTEEDTDNVALISSAFRQILREGSPIKNVVLDLSCNTGGEADAAVYVAAAFLGKASISVEDPNTGALATNDYLCDTNFDGVFDEKDTLAGKGLNLYCLESSISFSCGNLVPALFKESPYVTLLGQRSSGGACSVIFVSTAIGSILRLSSNNRLSYLRNGSFYDIDQGVEPDFFLSKAESFFDRESLVEYIDHLK